MGRTAHRSFAELLVADAIYLGDVEPDAIYLGDTLLYTSGGVPANALTTAGGDPLTTVAADPLTAAA